MNKLETYKSFQHTDLVDSIKFDKLLSLQNEIVNRPGLHIDVSGIVTEEADKPSHVTNKGSNGDLSKVFSPEFVELFMSIRDKIIEAGAINPILNGFSVYRNPDSMLWHQDFNHAKHLPYDKIWRVFYTLYPTEQLENFKSELFITPDGVWPNIWNLELYNNFVGNMLTGHTQSFGHEYKQQGDHVNFNDILGMTWYDETV